MEAEKVLTLTGSEGSFLIRESESKPGQYALSIRTGSIVKHYSIRTLDSGGNLPAFPGGGGRPHRAMRESERTRMRVTLTLLLG